MTRPTNRDQVAGRARRFAQGAVVPLYTLSRWHPERFDLGPTHTLGQRATRRKRHRAKYYWQFHDLPF